MSQSKEEQVSLQAYYKWENAGRPESDGVQYWLEAESEIESMVEPLRSTDSVPVHMTIREVVPETTQEEKAVRNFAKN